MVVGWVAQKAVHWADSKDLQTADSTVDALVVPRAGCSAVLKAEHWAGHWAVSTAVGTVCSWAELMAG